LKSALIFHRAAWHGFGHPAHRWFPGNTISQQLLHKINYRFEAPKATASFWHSSKVNVVVPEGRVIVVAIDSTQFTLLELVGFVPMSIWICSWETSVTIL